MSFAKSVASLVLAAVFLIPTPALAIDQEGGGRLMVGVPTGEFGEAATDPGFGIALHYGVRPVPTLTFGVGGDLLIYGSETTRVRLPLVEDFELNTTNNIAGGYLFAQVRPLEGPVQPYVEARLGLHYLWTESKLQDADWFDDGEVARTTNYDDLAAYWGLGGGLLIRLSKGNKAEKSPGVFLDLKVTSLQGGNAEYLTEGDIEIVNNLPRFNASESETDLTTYELGVVLTF